MAKAKTTAFFCKECGYESAKWMGQCPACKEWNTFVEEPIVKKESSSSGKIRLTERRKPVALSEISIEEKDRISTGYQELDRVLGGGVVGGSLVLVGGDPGIGKSTLLLQVCRNLASNGQKVLYISGEESLKQIKLRANRIGAVTGQSPAAIGQLLVQNVSHQCLAGGLVGVLRRGGPLIPGPVPRDQRGDGAR